MTAWVRRIRIGRTGWLLALALLKEQRSRMQHFALTQAGADSLDMACGGDVTVLFQFISPEDILWQSVLETALDRLTAAQPGWLILRTDGSAPPWPTLPPSLTQSRWCAAIFGTSPARCPCPRRIMWW